MFIDEAMVHLSAGNGGDGCVSFCRERFRPRGGPDGGDGGDGGNIVVIGDENAGDLRPYRFQPNYQAGNGEPGRGRGQHGARGVDYLLRLPPGTAIYRHTEHNLANEVLAHGKDFVLLHGGIGGWGNRRFKSAVNQAPRTFVPGKPGGSGAFHLVLKTLADIGLIGLPNAGKSSLLTSCTQARPKIAPYAFTTLHPKIGILEDPEHFKRVSLVDIPGLIAGAHADRGLGHRFLRHIERCPLILFVLEMAESERRSPTSSYALLLEELRLYDRSLLKKPRLIAANKIDLPEAATLLRNFRQAFPEEKLYPISCCTGDGLKALKHALITNVHGEK